MDTFKLLLDQNLSVLENELSALTGSIVGLGVPGGEVSLEIDLGDSSPSQIVSVRDDGTGADLVAGDGIIQFATPIQYVDDNPTVTPFDVYNISVNAREQVVSGTDAVFVIDISGSTGSSAGFDVNGDGNAFNDSILDAQVAAFKALNQELIDRGLGDTSKVSISAYSSSATLLDLDPVAAGVQTFTTPNADADGDGVRDIDQALDALFDGGLTNFAAGLEEAIDAINAAGTAPGAGSVIFLSDGNNNSGGSFADEVDTLKTSLGQSVRAFGVGSGSVLSQLQAIDPNAERFTDIRDLLGLFSGTGANSNQSDSTTDVTVNNVAPDVVLDPPGTAKAGETFSLAGMFTDPGVEDTFTVDVNWGEPTSSAAIFDLPAVGSLSVGAVFNSSTGDVLTITAVDTNTGKVNFELTHVYQAEGPVDIAVAIADDDSATGTQSVQLSVLPADGTPPTPPTPPTTPLIPNPTFNPINSVVGSTGDDGLTGTAGDDSLKGLKGKDVLSGGDGNDYLDGGAGFDTALYQFDPAGVVVDLRAGTATDGYGSTDTLKSIENVIGSDFTDQISGNGRKNNLTGRDGDDVLDGKGGQDFLFGGAGADDLTGGGGADTFLYTAATEGGDIIRDFKVGTDKIMIVGATFAGISNGGVPSADQFFSGDSASLGSHRFGYDANTGNVLFDADGVGGADAQVLATLTGTPAFSNTDIQVI